MLARRPISAAHVLAGRWLPRHCCDPHDLVVRPAGDRRPRSLRADGDLGRRATRRAGGSVLPGPSAVGDPPRRLVRRDCDRAHRAPPQGRRRRPRRRGTTRDRVAGGVGYARRRRRRQRRRRSIRVGGRGRTSALVLPEFLGKTGASEQRSNIMPSFEDMMDEVRRRRRSHCRSPRLILGPRPAAVATASKRRRRRRRRHPRRRRRLRRCWRPRGGWKGGGRRRRRRRRMRCRGRGRRMPRCSSRRRRQSNRRRRPGPRALPTASRRSSRPTPPR